MNNSDFNPTFDDLGSLTSALVQIGFELEDCQLAIQNGKLTADEIIDWITAGKPVMKSSQPVLKLDAKVLQTSSGSSSHGPSDVSGFSADSSAFGLERTPAVGEANVPLVSRINQNEEQRQFKLRFEEKRREEAKREAQQDKIAKKKALEESRRLIQEDREKIKARSANLMSQSTQGGASGTSTEITNQNLPLQDGNGSILRIRLIDGKILKQSFATETALREVREFVQKRCYGGDAVCLLQPFPHVEFSEADMARNLRELGFVPNGSLVVKKADIAPKPELDRLEIEEDDPMSSVGQPKTIKPLDPVAPFLDVVPPFVPVPPPTNHTWGTGQKLVSEPDAQVPPDASNQDDDEAMESDEDLSPPSPPPLQQPQPNFPAQLPAFPPFPGHPGGGAFGGFDPGQMHFQHDWGFGNTLAGPVLENVVLPHHNRDPRTLAAEAASHRYVVPPQFEPSRTSSDILVTQPELPSLRDILLKLVAVQLCDPRSRITGLHGIPESLASMILNTLIKERLLKPATLQMFISCGMQKIVLDSYMYCTNELLRGIRHHAYLKNLSVKSCSLITEKGLQSIAGLKFLKVLNLTGCVKIADSSVPIFSAITSLAVLVLDGTSVTDAGIASYAGTTPANLTALDLSRTEITEAVFPHLSNMPSLANLLLEQSKIKSLVGIHGLAKLTKLNVANTQIVTESMICLTGLSSLTSLNCANTPNVNGDAAVSYLANIPLREFHLPNRLTTTDVAISHITAMKLSTLDLSNFIYITDASMPFVGQLKKLKKLLLSNTKITDVGMKYLEGLLELEELDLDRTTVTNAVAGTIRVFSKLRELSLCNTGITNGFLMTGAVNQCMELTRLNLSRNMISDKGIVCLRLPSLTTLKVDCTYVSVESLEVVRSGCPLLGNFTFKTLLPLPRDASDFD